jgi:fermentation-respiration switch protein FrsA (DUF1100 family)
VRRHPLAGDFPELITSCASPFADEKICFSSRGEIPADEIYDILKNFFQSIRRYTVMLLVAALAAILLWTVIIVLFEEKFVFYPSSYPAGYYSQQSLKTEDCWFNADDGLRLHGWYIKHQNPMATIVMSHGNAGNISHRLDILRNLLRNGFSVFIYDYRGYGRSEGSPTEQGLYKDSQAAYRYALTLPGVDTSKIILWGTSIGGVFAVEAALHRQPALLVLESTFSSGRDVAASLWPYLPVRFFVGERYNSASRIKGIHAPTLFIHGSNDDIIPIALGKKLYDLANDPKEFYEIKGAGHNDTFIVGKTEYFEIVRSFSLRFLSPAKGEISTEIR